MSTFFTLLYVGGVFAMWSRKIGVMDRLTWPFTLGEWLHEAAKEATERDSHE